MSFKVLVVDDSAFMRKAIRAMAEQVDGVEIAGNARNGREAVDLAQKLKPDLVTLDIEMPDMDGLTALRQIMKTAPTKVVMVSSLTTEGSQAALTALKLGAIDIIAKDGPDPKKSGASGIEHHLVRLVRTLRDEKGEPASSSAAKGHTTQVGTLPKPLRPADAPVGSFDPAKVDLLLIGSSTGGPALVEQLVLAMPKGFRPAVVIAQHMPEVFTRSMTQRLESMADLTVHHLSDGDAIEPGAVYVCPGSTNTHLRQRGDGLSCRISKDPEGTLYFPSVDVLYETASSIMPRRTLAITLTGMGDDGSRGAAKLVDAGGTLLAQNKETCVVYGMPRAVIEAGLAAQACTPDQLVGAIGAIASTSARVAA